MFRSALGAVSLVLLSLLAPPPLRAATPEEVNLLGSDREAEQYASYLPFERRFTAQGVVGGSLAQSVAAAGVPPAAMLDALRAFATAVDLEREVSDGDRFLVHYERTFTAAGNPVGIGRVMWAELALAKRPAPLSIHRFRPFKAPKESFFLASGQSTEPPMIRLPLDEVTVTSGFGLRADPFDQPAGRGFAVAMPPMGPILDAPRPTTPIGGGIGSPTLNSYAQNFAATTRSTYKGPRYSSSQLAMHAGVDLLAKPGTPIRAAGDGMVIGAQPKGPYGNWIEIAHEGNFSTVYGHLAAYAPGIEPGVLVHQGQVIGFTGNTGRSTGPHLHFELLAGGRPTNPMISHALRRGRLVGPDLDRFVKVVAHDRAAAGVP